VGVPRSLDGEKNDCYKKQWIEVVPIHYFFALDFHFQWQLLSKQVLNQVSPQPPKLQVGKEGHYGNLVRKLTPNFWQQVQPSLPPVGYIPIRCHTMRPP